MTSKTTRSKAFPAEMCERMVRLVGEDVAETLDLVAAQLKVTETARLKSSCHRCERMLQPLAPSRLIPCGLAGPGLLAHILVATFDDYVRLYRQGEIYVRHGVDTHARR